MPVWIRASGISNIRFNIVQMVEIVQNVLNNLNDLNGLYLWNAG